MVTNTFQNIDMVVEETLVTVQNMLALPNRVLRGFDDMYGKPGAKIGDTLRFKLPPRYSSTVGPAPTAQNFTQNEVAIAAQTQRNMLLTFTTKDLSLSLDDIRGAILEPWAAQLASDIDLDGTSTISQGYSIVNANSNGQFGGSFPGAVGLATPGAISKTAGPAAWTGVAVGSGATSQATAMQPFANAKMLLDQASVPKNERYVAVSPAAMSFTVPQVIPNLQFNDATIGDQYKSGFIKRMMDADWYEANTVTQFTSGAWTQATTLQVNVTSTSGATTLVVKGAGNADTFIGGDQFVVASVNSVNPLTRLSTGFLQVSTILSPVTASAGGDVTWAVYPPYINSGQYQTVGTLPQANARITMMGTTNTSTDVNFMWQKEGIAFVNAPLEDVSNYGAECYVATNPEDGLSLRYVKQYLSNTDTVNDRVDILYGWAVIRPSFICRIQG